MKVIPIQENFPSKSKSVCTLDQGESSNSVTMFSKYFASVAQILKANAIPLMNFVWRFTPQSSPRTNKVFSTGYVSKIFIEKELRSLVRNKATGIDDLPPGMLKDCAALIAKPLCHIINLSLRSSTIPSIWKVAKITPIFKSGNTSLTENYRPISVLLVLSKILEKAMHLELISYLEREKLLHDSQYGFRSKRSTKLASTLLCDSIRREVDSGRLVGAVYIDLSKAFDTIGHAILLQKLQTYGITGKELAWFQDYLFYRSQIVELCNTQSKCEPIFCGVPQGSILGPLMFVIFYNDFVDYVSKSSVIMYADDTVIYVSDTDVFKIETYLNQDLEKISQYFRENELIMNLKKGKSEVMLFGTAKRLKLHGKSLNVEYQGKQITFVSKYKYLGTVIDSHLNMSDEFNLTYKKASSRLRLLQRLRNYLTVESSRNIYLMMIAPLLTYSSTHRIPFTNTQSQKLRSLDKRASSIISSDSIPTIEGQIKRDICLLVKKCLLKELTSDTFNEYFLTNQHNKGTRNNNYSVRLPQVKLEYAKQSFYFLGGKSVQHIASCTS